MSQERVYWSTGIRGDKVRLFRIFRFLFFFLPDRMMWASLASRVRHEYTVPLIFLITSFVVWIDAEIKSSYSWLFSNYMSIARSVVTSARSSKLNCRFL